MYKDKNKQREAQREWVRQERATKGSTTQGSTDSLRQPSPLEDVDSFASDGAIIDEPKRGKDIKSFADLPPDVQ